MSEIHTKLDNFAKKQTHEQIRNLMLVRQRWEFHGDCVKERFLSTGKAVGKDRCMGVCFRERKCVAGWTEF